MLVLQTTKEIYLQETLSGKWKALTSDRMAKLYMQRGYKNVIYFAERTVKGSDMEVIELKVSKVGSNWTESLQEVKVVREGRVIALELDPANRSATDSVYTYGRKLLEDRDNVTNKIYIVDDKENMFYLRQKFDYESGNRYELLSETNLSLVKDLTLELNKFKMHDFNRCVVNFRCITLNDANFSFCNGHSWSLKIQKESDRVDDKDDD